MARGTECIHSHRGDKCRRGRVPERAKRPCPVAGEIEICNHNPLMNGRSKTRETSPDRLGSPFLSRSNERPGCLGAYSGAVGGARGFDSKDSVHPARSPIETRFAVGHTVLARAWVLAPRVRISNRNEGKDACPEEVDVPGRGQTRPGGDRCQKQMLEQPGSAINPPWTV